MQIAFFCQVFDSPHLLWLLPMLTLQPQQKLSFAILTVLQQVWQIFELEGCISILVLLELGTQELEIIGVDQVVVSRPVTPNQNQSRSSGTVVCHADLGVSE